MRNLYIVAALVTALTLAGCPARQTVPASRPHELLIIYSGNTLGELKPCGCAREEDQGGIERRMGYLKQARASAPNTLVVDLGDSFKHSTRQGRLKAETLLTAMARMRYDAVTLGDRDLLYGRQLLKARTKVPWLSSNLHFKEWNLPRFKIKTFGDGLKVAVLAVSDPDLFYTEGSSSLRVEPPAAALKELLKRMRKETRPDLVVLLSHMRRERGLVLLKLEGVDIVINGHIEKDTDTVDMKPVRQDGKIFVQPGPLGQKMGELRVSLSADGEKNFQQRMVRLGSNAPIDAEMTQLYDQYNAQVEELFFASLKEKRAKKENPVYATETVCRTCHAGAHDVWSKSRHGHAYATLTRVHKSFDPECLRCHTTGFNRPGGFISEIDTPQLKNVQCEMCHGPRLEHSRAPKGGFALEARKACRQCHVKKHSPKFNYGKYWPKIRH